MSYAKSKTIGKITCNHCNNKYDVNSWEFTKCPCGKTSVKVSEYSTTYKDGSDYTREYKDLTTYYEEDDLIKLDNRTQKYLDKMIELTQKKEKMYDFTTRKYWCFRYHPWKENVKLNNGEIEKRILRYDIKYETSDSFNQNLTVNLRIDLKNQELSNEEIYNRLKIFRKKIITPFVLGEKFGISNLKELSVKDGFGWDREQKDLYDYNFYL